MPPVKSKAPLLLSFSSQGAVFVAAVEFLRLRTTLVKTPGYESYELHQLPNVDWWWYEIELKPVRTILGEWDADQSVLLRGQFHLGSMPDTRWAGLIVRNDRKELAWFGDLLLREGKVLQPVKQTVLGPQTLLDSYLRELAARKGLLIP